MRAAAVLDPDKTRRQLLEKRQHTPTCQATANNNLPCGVNSMNLKDSLCDIQSYGCNNAIVPSSPASADRVPQFGWKAVHSIKSRPARRWSLLMFYCNYPLWASNLIPLVRGKFQCGFHSSKSRR
jgi:hypothetical protein